MTLKGLGEFIERTTGLALDRGGVSTALDRFVSERIQELGLKRPEEYFTLASNPLSPEQHRLIDAITVRHTWFFRDPEQLQMIAKILLGAPPGRISIWAAGCATGEEAYTLAMIARRVGREATVLATDINETSLEIARRGLYSALAVRDVPELDRHWLSQQENRFLVDPELRSDVSFMRHNLVDPPPPAGTRGGWDMVVCRNVLIYFAPPTVTRVLDRFARSLREGGSLVVGASEVVFEPPVGLELVPLGNRLVLRRPSSSSTELPLPRRLPSVMTPALGIPVISMAPPRPPTAPGLTPTRPITVPPTPITLPPTPLSAFAPSAATSTPSVPSVPSLPSVPPSVPSMPSSVPSVPAPMPSMPSASVSMPSAFASTPSASASMSSASASMSSASSATSAPNGVRDEDLIAALTRGHALFERGEVAAAIPVYEEITRRRGDVAEPWLFLGIARYVQGDVNEAAKALRSSLCLAPTLWPADFYLARAYERLGRGAEALHHYNLVSANEQKPLTLRSVSAVINELRALRYDFQAAARRVAAERSAPPRRSIK